MPDNNLSVGDRDSKVLVSVVMAVYFGVRYEYFVEAVDSILKQDFTDFEFIIVADGDLTQEQMIFLRGLEEKYEVVTAVFLSKNIGPGAARNHGIKRSRGEYIAIMDSDDISFPNRLSTEVDYLNQNIDISVVGSACEVIDSTGTMIGSRFLPENSAALKKYAAFFCPLNNPTVMGRAAVLKEFRYKEILRKGEDHRLWLELLRAGHKLSNIGQPLLRFRADAELYKRRVGLDKAMSDLTNRLYGLKISPLYMKPFVLIFAFVMFLVRFMPGKIVSVFSNSLFAFFLNRRN